MLNWLGLGVSTIRISMPYASGALGGTLSERGGVVNIALEGLMLAGAFAFVTTSWWMEGQLGPETIAAMPWVAPLAGAAAAIAAGFLLSLIHALATVTFKVDNIISGVALNILSLGLTNFLLKRIFDSSSNSERCLTFHNFSLFHGGGAFANLNHLLNPLIAISLLLFAASHFLLYFTRFGLRLRACGENPAAADSVGVNVSFYRYGGVLLGGMIASLGGVWLANEQGMFSSNMTAGRGYIALAAMIIGKWRPWGAAGACLIFGFAEALQNQLQIYSNTVASASPETIGMLGQIMANVPRQLIQALPYLLTIIIIAGLIGRSTPPAAVGVPYEKGKKSA